jgi:hypothetical protein
VLSDANVTQWGVQRQSNSQNAKGLAADGGFLEANGMRQNMRSKPLELLNFSGSEARNQSNSNEGYLVVWRFISGCH